MLNIQLVNTVCIFVLLMLGHFVGDYLLQNDKMALNKARRDPTGWAACGIHVLLYTTGTIAFLGFAGIRASMDWRLLLVIAVPHYVIDHYSLASYWMKFKNGIKPFDTLKPGDEVTAMTVWRTSFIAPVYIVNDNTIHWVCLLFTAYWLAGK
jgi:hypothetical protein